MRRQLDTPDQHRPTTLRAQLAASLTRFATVTLSAAGTIVALWLFSALLAPGNAAAATVTPMVASTHSITRTASAAPFVPKDIKKARAKQDDIKDKARARLDEAKKKKLAAANERAKKKYAAVTKAVEKKRAAADKRKGKPDQATVLRRLKASHERLVDYKQRLFKNKAGWLKGKVTRDARRTKIDNSLEARRGKWNLIRGERRAEVLSLKQKQRAELKRIKAEQRKKLERIRKGKEAPAAPVDPNTGGAQAPDEPAPAEATATAPADSQPADGGQQDESGQQVTDEQKAAAGAAVTAAVAMKAANGWLAKMKVATQKLLQWVGKVVQSAAHSWRAAAAAAQQKSG